MSIAPTAIDVKIALPVNSIPAIAISTVRPEISTACPDVAPAVSSASRGERPARALLPLAAEVEERVVDADRHPDQQDHGLRRVAGRDDVAREAESPIVASTPENASSTGSPAATSAPNATSMISSVTGSDEYSARWKSLFSVLLSSWFALAKPNSATVKSWMPRLDAIDRVEDRLHLLVGLVLVARDLELHESGVAVLGDLTTVRALERRANSLDVGQPLDRAHDVGHRGAKAGVGQRSRVRADENALRRLAREPGVVEHLLSLLRPARGGVGLLQHLRARDRAERDRDDAEREPARDCRLPVVRAPSAARAAMFALILPSDPSTPSFEFTVPAAGPSGQWGYPTFAGCGNPYLEP